MCWTMGKTFEWLLSQIQTGVHYNLERMPFGWGNYGKWVVSPKIFTVIENPTFFPHINLESVYGMGMEEDSRVI